MDLLGFPKFLQTGLAHLDFYLRYGDLSCQGKWLVDQTTQKEWVQSVILPDSQLRGYRYELV